VPVFFFQFAPPLMSAASMPPYFAFHRFQDHRDDGSNNSYMCAIALTVALVWLNLQPLTPSKCLPGISRVISETKRDRKTGNGY
jgi:hypothetical protein